MGMIKKQTGTCNNYLIKNKGASILIDCGFRNKKEYESLLAGENIRLIILSHEHNDHCVMLQEIKQKFHIPVLMHTHTAGIVSKGAVSIPVGITIIGKIVYKSFEKNKDKMTYTPATADITFSKEYDLKEFGINGKVMHTPGHSQGSVSVILDNKIMFIGDTLFNSPLFNIRFKTPHFCDSIPLLKESLKSIINLKPDTIYLGHGKRIKLNDVKKTLVYIERKYPHNET